MQQNNTPQARGIRAWLPIIGLAFAAFVFNTSEFLPVGLLTDMAHSLGESVPQMGLVITGYAWIVAVMSLPLTILTAKLERKKLLLALIALFAFCHFAVLHVATFGALFATRAGVALAHSIFWSIMTPLAARMAPHGKRGVGLACVMGGSIVATVLGVPIGTQLGIWVGWQYAFFTIGVGAALLFVVIALVLPRCQSRQAGSLSSLPKILRRPALLELYFLTATVVLAHYTTYSYISPILAQVGGYSSNAIVFILFVFGISGIIGTFAGGYAVDHFASACLVVPIALVASSLALLVPSLSFEGSAVVLVIVWSASMTALCMAFQTKLLDVASDAADVATSLYSGIFNIGIGGGAFVGSILSNMHLAEQNFLPLPFIASCVAFCALLATLMIWKTKGQALFPYETANSPLHTQKGEEVDFSKRQSPN